MSSLFAHVFNAAVLDPQPAADVATYRAFYNANVIATWDAAGHAFKAVPLGTRHGATDDGLGNYMNPDGSVVNANGSVTPAPIPQPLPPPVPKTIGMNDLTVWLQAIATKVGAPLPPITGT